MYAFQCPFDTPSLPAACGTNSEIEGSKAMDFSEGTKAGSGAEVGVGSTWPPPPVPELGSTMGMALRGSLAVKAEGRF